MIVTLAICTWNRAKLLDRTLSCLPSLRIPGGVDLEVLVVNNNCTDDTDSVIARHAAILPLRRLFEPKAGLSNARNAAVQSARGELLLWTDDDVRLDPCWIEAYVAAARAFPDSTFFGGAVRPDYEVSPPRWLEENATIFSGALALLDLGSEVRPFKGGELPFGASMGFRTKALRRKSFDPQLGRIGDSLLGGEESACCEALIAEGHTGIWVGTAVAYHHVPRSRMTREYILKWHTGAGVTAAQALPLESRLLWLGLPRWTWRRIGYYFFLQLISICTFRGCDIVASANLARFRGMRQELRAKKMLAVR